MKNSKTIKNIGKYLVMLVMTYIMLATTTLSAVAFEPTTSKNVSIDTEVVTMAETSGWSNISNWLSGVTSNVKNIGYAIAILAVVALAIVFITGGGQALQKGKGMAIGILVGVAVLSFGASIISSLME